MDIKLTEDYFADYPNIFTLEPCKTAFIPVDLQYGSACRTTGLGNLLKQQGKDQ
jgi:hypothetical protein